jgi:hypothetical protein
LKRWLLEPEYPSVAIEVRPRSIGAVRAQRGRGRWVLGAAASLTLPDRTISLSMTQPNVVEPVAFRETIQSLLERAGIPLAGTIGLVLPDPVARVYLMPAADVSGKDSAETEEMIRFRLRKAVPFDIKDARLAIALPGPEVKEGEGQVIAVAIARGVLEGYEQALGALGLHVGLVELSGLAILSAIEGARPPGDHLVVNWDEGYVSLLLSRAGQLVLARTLTGEAATSREDVVREAANTVLYYQEKLGGAGLDSVIIRSAVLPPHAAAELLREPVGLVPEVLDPWAGAEAADGGLHGQAVAGAAACVMGKPL